MSRAAVVFFCPYCSEEDLRPVPDARTAWRCTSCTRAFVVTPAATKDAT
jgi:transposase-like protein